MASKCDKCEKLKALQAKCERLENKLNRLLDAEPVQKVHFDLDGQQTACGIDLFEHDVDLTENMKEVTCGNCRSKWRSMKAKWDKEWKKEQKENGHR